MERVLGNIFVRTMHFEKAGDKCGGHTHNFDHVTLVLTGGVRIQYWKNQELLGERDIWAPKQIAGDSGAEAQLLIKADIEHEITALADYTHCWCVFAHRDPISGEVVQEWNGWEDAAR